MTDTSTGGGFDPRFNPAFQPGYDPSVHARPPVVPECAGVPELIEHPLPPASRVPLDSTPLPSGHPEQAEEPAVARRFDPYLVGLWVLSIVFVVAGLLTIRYIADRLNITGGGSAFDYNLVLVYTIAAPLLVILGLATATGTVFLIASRRRWPDSQPIRFNSSVPR